jgi:hypothetical protein
MSNSTASAHDDDRPARPQPGAHGYGAADARPQQGSGTDPEILELVERFEAAFADLGPSVEEARQSRAAEADLFPDFSQDIFAETPAAASVAVESARVFPMPRRDSEPAFRPAPQPASSATPAPPDEVTLDEALSILRASENRGAGAAPAAQGPAPSFDARTSAEAGERPRQRRPGVRLDAEDEPESRRAAPDWTTKSHKARSIALVATAAALVVGIAVGYFYGRNPAAQSPSPAIGASQHGGTTLRLDPELHPR